MTVKLTTPQEHNEFIDKFDNFLFDCDGVLWDGSVLIPGILEAMQKLREKGKNIYFVTNNSTTSRASFLKKFEKLGIQANLDEIFSSAFATASYLKNVLNFPQDKKVYVIGMTGITEELAQEGIQSCGAEADSGLLDNDAIPNDPSVGAVVVGLDTQVNYKKYAKAFTYLRNNSGIPFIATNEDTTFPIHGTLQPGAGSIAAPLITALNRRPDIVLGKPAQNMMEAIFAQYNLDKAKTCMIGDRLDTDIDFGLKGGLETLCVLTGMSTRRIQSEVSINVQGNLTSEWKEAFSLYDKKGNSTVSSTNLGDLLRGLGQNPTQAEVRELIKSVGEVDIDFGTFLTILTRPDGFKPAGSSQEFIQGFQVFDKDGDGYISAGELRYVLTNLGEKLSDEEVDELLKEVEVGKDGRINYVDFVTLVLSN
ncbi:HAD-like domain-containing protein [Chlamydoabsidia padenii]|nr:HAD-like domain-containing protein [Chlamydoabsidia padenii]